MTKINTGKNQRWLKRRYNYFNKKFFKNRLSPKVKVSFNKQVLEEPSSPIGMVHGDTIWIDPGLSRFPDFADIVLLHEMAHLQNDMDGCFSEHGSRFQTIIDCLYSAGAYKGLL